MTKKKQAQERFVIAVGNAWDGMKLWGDPKKGGEPWDDVELATNYAERAFDNVEWTLVDIGDPSKE
jgi:hypothetical protein